VVDVRNQDEVLETGKLKYGLTEAHTIPLPELELALKLGEDEFRGKYNFQKPQETDEVIFSCRSGKRSVAASIIAERSGLRNVFNYTGGALDWFSS